MLAHRFQHLEVLKNLDSRINCELFRMFCISLPEWVKHKPLTISRKKGFDNMANPDDFVSRNLTGIKLEKEGKVDEAIALYEANVAEKFDGSHPYNRLAIIYRKRKQLTDEIRVLESAIWVFENVVYKKYANRIPKLQKFRARLKKAKELLEKQQYRQSAPIFV